MALDFFGTKDCRARLRAHFNLPRLKSEELKRGSSRSAEATLPRMNVGAPAERRRDSFRDGDEAHSNLPRVRRGWVIALGGIVAVAAFGGVITATTGDFSFG